MNWVIARDGLIQPGRQYPFSLENSKGGDNLIYTYQTGITATSLTLHRNSFKRLETLFQGGKPTRKLPDRDSEGNYCFNLFRRFLYQAGTYMDVYFIVILILLLKGQFLEMEVWLILGVVESMPSLKERVNPFIVVPICTDDT